jgi:hypothetical protein
MRTARNARVFRHLLEQGMAPIGATGNRPLFRRQRAGLEGVAKRPDPGRRNSAAQQEIALVVEQPRVFGVKPTEPGARQKLRDGYRLAQEVGLSRYAQSTNLCTMAQYAEPVIGRAFARPGGYCLRALRGERGRRACQAAKSLARLGRGRIFGLPLPHHASRPLGIGKSAPSSGNAGAGKATCTARL